MKLFYIFCFALIFTVSCTVSKYGFPYKTKVETKEIDNTIFITIDSTELFGMYNDTRLDRKLEGRFIDQSVSIIDSIDVFMIETMSDTFTIDFDFHYNNKPVKVDSFSFFCTFTDSISIDTSRSRFEYGYEKIGVSNFYKFPYSNQIKFPLGIKLIQDLILYSEEKTYRFNNYFIWL